MKEAQYQKMTAFCRKTKTREKITAGITKYLPDLLAAASSRLYCCSAGPRASLDQASQIHFGAAGSPDFSNGTAARIPRAQTL